MIEIRDPKTFYFDFDWIKNLDENLKRKIEFFIKSNESLVENKIKSEIVQSLSKYKNGDDIHEHGKQQKQ